MKPSIILASQLLTAMTVLLCNPLHAEVHQHDAHVHGEATLNLVIDNTELLLELESPAANLLGFEHAPKNKAQQQQLDKTKSLLSKIDSLITTTGLKCQLVSAEIEMPYTDHNHGHKHHEHQHDHGHSDEHPKSETSEHSEIHAQYSLSCDSQNTIKQMNVSLFKYFPGLEKLQVMWINGNQQGIANLTPNNSALLLNQ